MDFTGYIEYEKEIYTFTYKDKLLTLIINDPMSHESWLFNSPKMVDYLKGYTSQGREIFFYVSSEITKYNGVIKCYPKIVIYLMEILIIK